MKIRLGSLVLATVTFLLALASFSSQAQATNLCPIKIDSKNFNFPSYPQDNKIWTVATRSQDSNFFCLNLFAMSVSKTEGVHSTPQGKVYVRYTKSETVITFQEVPRKTNLFIDGNFYNAYQANQTVSVPGRRKFLLKWAN